MHLLRTEANTATNDLRTTYLWNAMGQKVQESNQRSNGETTFWTTYQDYAPQISANCANDCSVFHGGYVQPPNGNPNGPNGGGGGGGGWQTWCEQNCY